MTFCYFFKKLFTLKCIWKTEGKTDRAPIYLYTFKMPTTIRAGLGRTQQPGIQCRSLLQMAESQVLEPPHAALRVHNSRKLERSAEWEHKYRHRKWMFKYIQDMGVPTDVFNPTPHTQHLSFFKFFFSVLLTLRISILSKIRVTNKLLSQAGKSVSSELI